MRENYVLTIKQNLALVPAISLTQGYFDITVLLLFVYSTLILSFEFNLFYPIFSLLLPMALLLFRSSKSHRSALHAMLPGTSSNPYLPGCFMTRSHGGSLAPQAAAQRPDGRMREEKKLFKGNLK